MAILRWTVFLPLAFVAAIIAGAVAYYFGNRFGTAWFDAGVVVGWIASGLASSAAFVVVGVQVAPVMNATVKWLLAGLLFLVGGVSAIGAFFGGDDQMAAIPGAVMICVAIGLARTRANELHIK